MKVLVACEFSGVVRDAFTNKGHQALSCDLRATDSPGPHYQGDVFDIINAGWDLMVAHPPCTYLCSSGLHWNKTRPGRSALTKEALVFVSRLLEAPIPMIALENPVGCISTRIRPADQYIQPYEYGHDVSKKTGLWLVGLPLLQATGPLIAPRINPPSSPWPGRPRWGNQTSCGRDRMGSTTPDRSAKRAITYTGIAAAMADQWGPV